MAKKQTKIVYVKLMDGKLRRMIFDANAMVNIEEATGLNLLKDSIRLPDMKDPIRFLVVFFWACMVHEDPDLTPERVGELMLPKQVPEAFTLMGKLMGQNADPNSLAPFVPSDIAVVQRALKVAGLKAGETFVDIGCGDGRTLEIALRDFNAGFAIGYESDAGRATASGEKLLPFAPNYLVVQDNFLTMDPKELEHLRKADVVFVYLLGISNNRIAATLEKYCKLGCRVVSHDFTFQNWVGTASERIREGTREHGIYLYTLGEHLDTPLQASDIIPDVSDIKRAGWEYAEKNRRPVFRYGDIAAVSWQGGGKWFGRVAGQGAGAIPLGPFAEPLPAMEAVEAALAKISAEQKQQLTEGKDAPAKETTKP